MSDFNVLGVKVRVEGVVRPKTKTIQIDGTALSRSVLPLREMSCEVAASLGAIDQGGTNILGVEVPGNGIAREWFCNTAAFPFVVEPELELLAQSCWLKITYEVEQAGQTFFDTVCYPLDPTPNSEPSPGQTYDFLLRDVGGEFALIICANGAGATSPCVTLQIGLSAAPPASFQAAMYRTAAIINLCV